MAAPPPFNRKGVIPNPTPQDNGSGDFGHFTPTSRYFIKIVQE
jgi:hypothetical protein